VEATRYGSFFLKDDVRIGDVAVWTYWLPWRAFAHHGLVLRAEMRVEVDHTVDLKPRRMTFNCSAKTKIDLQRRRRK
jgi:hypothetical protein